MTTPAPHTAMAPPSGWVQRWSHLVRSGGTVLDVACGGGRHLAWFAARGHAVTGIDIDTQAASGQVPAARLVQADIEQGPWPLAKAAGVHEEFDAVVVTNYLWRPLWGHLLASLAPGGVLLYETFSTGNETVGRPSRPDFLLQRAELLQVCAGLRIVAFEEGTLEQPARFVQRIAAVREVQNGQPPALPPVYLL
ncbi:class I SAM-dependent methyltransferase [Curvibacter sp. APW13]|uniref:class I SAM-dependent methyltransferase n=1 Tax=Curvibacter sp. APW13 TaxID=3077236 RepID=UPI0028E00559|nr:class I SAM-dependent methyltransferase [Curvibacter sp. APW13]MDT8991023.1 class I SAM-dependent methyltransferase [Curvibacter sp. APW13]